MSSFLCVLCFCYILNINKVAQRHVFSRVVQDEEKDIEKFAIKILSTPLQSALLCVWWNVRLANGPLAHWLSLCSLSDSEALRTLRCFRSLIPESQHELAFSACRTRFLNFQVSTWYSPYLSVSGILTSRESHLHKLRSPQAFPAPHSERFQQQHFFISLLKSPNMEQVKMKHWTE